MKYEKTAGGKFHLDVSCVPLAEAQWVEVLVSNLTECVNKQTEKEHATKVSTTYNQLVKLIGRRLHN